MISLRWLLMMALTMLMGAQAQSAPDAKTADAAKGAAPLVSASDPPSVVYPQRREINGYSLVIHAPQISRWPDFSFFEASIAIELTPPDGSGPRFGTARISGSTDIDMKRRIVTVRSPSFSNVHFSGGLPANYTAALKGLAARKELAVPLDLFLAYLADDVLSNPPPRGFNTEAPVIHVAQKPTILLFVNGDPVLADVSGTGLQVVANANWPTFKDPARNGLYYLLCKDLWLASAKLERGWKKAQSLPAGFAKLAADGEQAAVRSAVPLKASALPLPDVMFGTRPAELIVTTGKPTLQLIPDSAGLSFVSNTESPLFRLNANWYYLVAGRWFATTDLDKGPWVYSPTLPAAFSGIPADHAMARVRASVPGTVEARMAALEALLPVRTGTARNATAPVTVSFAGEPRFETIAGTQVARAVNSGYDIIQYQNQYYLCYAGVWYQAGSPLGPWQVAPSVPDAIYAIPPSSPSYQVTQVKVVQSTPTTVVYAYPPSYSSGIYVVYGVPYYGTGWYYPPYVSGRYYYPYPASYGHGSWYNPATGGYGSRSVWYGPYGGYSYTQGYNPATGRYGYVETAWDGDEWASHGQTYNARTGVGTETSRYYNEDTNRSEMERTAQRGDDWVKTDRNTDWDTQTSSVERETSKGGSSQGQREWSNGTLSGSGTVTAGDGRTATYSGEQTRAGGSGTVTGSEGSVNTSTNREGGKSATQIEGSAGGSGTSVSGQGPGRTTVGQSGSGDLYAGHNGNVYKKTDDGWQHYDDGGWQQVDTPEHPESSNREQTGQTAGANSSARASSASGSEQTSQAAATASSDRSASASGRTAGAGASGGAANRAPQEVSGLNRDASARQRGNQQFGQRSGGFKRNGDSGSGGGFQRKR